MEIVQTLASMGLLYNNVKRNSKLSDKPLECNRVFCFQIEMVHVMHAKIQIDRSIFNK